MAAEAHPLLPTAPAEQRAFLIETAKGALAGLILSIGIVGAIYLGLNSFDLNHHAAAYGCTIGATIAGGILGLYLSYRWVPPVRRIVDYVTDELSERFDDCIASTKVQNLN